MSRTSRSALAIALLLGANVASAAPAIFTYSGFLSDSGGTPVTTATDLTFRLYDAETTGNLLGGPETLTVTPNADGYFSVVVGAGMTGLEALFADQLFMSVEVQGDAGELDPRIPLTSVPSAMTATTAASATTVPWTGVTGFDGITGVVAGSGLSGGGTTGDVTLGLTGSCATNQILKWNGASWVCAADANSGGTVTSVGATAGGGITIVGGATANPTVGLSSCATAGYAMKWNGSAWACAADADSGGDITSVTAGSGLSGGGTTGAVTLSLNSAASPTFAGLTVTGPLHTGWERISGVAPSLTSYLNVAHYGGATAYVGIATATCSTGKVLLGGGCEVTGVTVTNSHMAINGPSSDSQWRCYGVSNSNLVTVTAFAICARLAL